MRKKAKALTENSVGFLFALGSYQSLHLNKRFHGFFIVSNLLPSTLYLIPFTFYMMNFPNLQLDEQNFIRNQIINIL